ncbi:MAG: hypothetical protein RSB34_09280 [Muribaculaceae bacterium]
MKANYDKRPTAISEVGNGEYRYRWGIEEITIPAMDNMPARVSWNCNEVVVYAPLTANKITEKVIDELWGHGVEAKLLNDYNAAQLGILDGSYVIRYKSFLTERKIIKDQIDKDCKTLNII